jgi:5-(carboxyamino)imidazole ribonucleotide synthase
VAPFAAVRSLADLQAGLERLGTPAILKQAAWGYDGKGQVRIDSPAGAVSAWAAVLEQESVLEALVPFAKEASVIVARGLDGAIAHFGVIENEHRDHVLDVSVSPAELPGRLAAEAVEIARTVVAALDVVGVLSVELFVTADDRLLVNELAPRPHNSGHFTFDACVTSQFEQQLRAVCGLPLGSTEQLHPAAMANLLGDLWRGGEPNWAAACAFPDVKLHLYGKSEARPGRKMGHLVAMADTPRRAGARVLAAREALEGGRS